MIQRESCKSTRLTVDEQTKNHQADSEKSSDGRMYEIKDSDRCPVRSFVKYVRRLNPKCSKLFQQAKYYPKEGVFYENFDLGHNRLGSFMTEISKAAKLSKVYTITHVVLQQFIYSIKGYT